MRLRSADEIPAQEGKVFIVTGSNTGIGFATAEVLAAKGATVILACRSKEKGSAALAKIVKTIPGADVAIEQLDLASLASVKAFAERVKSRHQRLDVLINNAGVMVPPFSRTEDGFENQFGANFLGPFALTGHLLPLLLATPSARVVTLSSIIHWFGRIDFDNLNAELGYVKARAYSQSKLADLLFAYELQRRLEQARSTTISVGAHPGATASDLSRHNKPVHLFLQFAAQSAQMGALPSLMAAISPMVKGGDYVGPGGFLTLKGLPTIQKSSALSHDRLLAARLWEVAQTLTGVCYL